MRPEEKSNIYDRLLDIKMSIEIQTVPNPKYINEKIGECRRYIEEVEKFMFQVSRESSVIQQALNNSTAEFESKKEDLLTKDEKIKSLPSIKDREAKANSCLKEEIDRIRGYQNEANAFNNLLRAINLKMKNLNGANADIKMQLRIMEAQIKLGGGPEADVAMRSLMEEMSKSNINKDMFEGIHTSVEESTVEDPTHPIDIQAMLKNENILEPEPEEDEEETVEEPQESEEPSWKSYLPTNGDTMDIKEEETLSVDLDSVIEEKNAENKGGIESKKEVISQTCQNTNPVAPKSTGNEIEIQKKEMNTIDIDSFLDNLTN